MIPGVAADGGLYPIEKLEAHRRGALHLAVSVFVFDGDALLIQQRAASKYHCPLQWANTCCTHPHWGESLAASAHRRVREELGFEAALTPGATIDYEADVGGGLREHERVTIFMGRADRAALTAQPDREEVAAVRWAAPADLAAEAVAAPDRFAPWFRIYLHRWADLGLPPMARDASSMP